MLIFKELRGHGNRYREIKGPMWHRTVNYRIEHRPHDVSGLSGLPGLFVVCLHGTLDATPTSKMLERRDRGDSPSNYPTGSTCAYPPCSWNFHADCYLAHPVANISGKRRNVSTGWSTTVWRIILVLVKWEIFENLYSSSERGNLCNSVTNFCGSLSFLHERRSILF